MLNTAGELTRITRTYSSLLKENVGFEFSRCIFDCHKQSLIPLNLGGNSGNLKIWQKYVCLWFWQTDPLNTRAWFFFFHSNGTKLAQEKLSGKMQKIDLKDYIKNRKQP